MKKPFSHQDSPTVGAHSLQDLAGHPQGLPGESDSGQSCHEQQKIGKKMEPKKKERERKHTLSSAGPCGQYTQGTSVRPGPSGGSQGNPVLGQDDHGGLLAPL